jgi:phosphatidylserine decarboxylase
MEGSGEIIERRYQSRFGVVTGYLPSATPLLDQWLLRLKESVKRARAADHGARSRAVDSLQQLIMSNGVVRMYVSEMLEGVPEPHRIFENFEDLLDALARVARTAPEFTAERDWRVFFPVSAIFTYMMMTPAGLAAFRRDDFNSAIREILQEWSAYLDSPESRSVLNEGPTGWLCPAAYEYGNLNEFVIPDRCAPHWGWSSYNEYFHRGIKPECRPVESPDDPKVIVSPNDGTVNRIATDLKPYDQFWLKEQPYSLADMLARNHVDRFVGGDVIQSFLSGADYHRCHSPVPGRVRHVQIVPGLMFSEAESVGPDTSAGTLSQAYGAAVNTRGLVFIERDGDLKMVCVIPIGMAEVSSIVVGVKAGELVKKGDELGYFSYGGSSMVVAFEPGVVRSFAVPAPSHSSGDPRDGPKVRVNSRLALAR